MSARKLKPSRALAGRLKILSRQRLAQPQDGSLYIAPSRRRPRWFEPPHPEEPPHFQLGQRSILLEPLNPIQHPRSFEHAKQPVTRLRSKIHERRMNEDERHIYANPYLRMISSPIRMCALTSRVLPMSFLVRLSIQKIPIPPEQQGQTGKQKLHTDGKGNILALLPDNPQRTDARTNGHGTWVVCNRSQFQAIPVKGVIHEDGPGLRATDRRLELHPQLLALIGLQLRNQVLYELEHLPPRLGVAPLNLASETIIRRLTWEEWHVAQATGALPNAPDAHAVIVFRIGAIRRRKKTDPPPKDDDPDPTRIRLLPPAATTQAFLKRGTVESESAAPVYDASTYFPNDTQREELRRKLNGLTHIEYIGQKRARFKGVDAVDNGKEEDGEEEDSRCPKPLSNAYAISSSATTVLRADTVPLVIALWRLRMWEDVHDDVQGYSWELPKDVTAVL
ncbi:hypothetical protein AURDEDRAFT_148468 [Auricularia subglabra TFB-10046 SS5]|nr:hypothetical protein AURDEDRAFT_148468 [Auricularia subglabra TFB-10046 SS5]